ncbi:hypothetical protein TYRP_015664 [Tyrophagus putrescentiae]|nr:hypothetical protein TYRP_015664 [Tyrophagus putrescentiae]
MPGGSALEDGSIRSKKVGRLPIAIVQIPRIISSGGGGRGATLSTCSSAPGIIVDGGTGRLLLLGGLLQLRRRGQRLALLALLQRQLQPQVVVLPQPLLLFRLLLAHRQRQLQLQLLLARRLRSGALQLGVEVGAGRRGVRTSPSCPASAAWRGQRLVVAGRGAGQAAAALGSAAAAAAQLQAAAAAADGRLRLSEALLRLQRPNPFRLQLLLVLQQGDQQLRLLPNAQPLVLVVLKVLKVLQRLNGEEVVAALLGDLLRPGLDQVLEEDQRLVDVAPVLAVVVQALPDDLHDLAEGDHVVGEVGDLAHQRAARPPGLV